MRVLHVSQPVEAGVANVVAALVGDQRERGHDVHLACPPGSALAHRANRLGATTHGWSSVRTPGPTVALECLRLRRIVHRVRPDLVVLHSAKAGLAGRIGPRAGHRTVYVPHAWSFEAVRGPLATAAARWELLAGRWTDLVVCVSEQERDAGLAVGVAAPMEVVPNGIDVRSRVPRPASRARLALGLADRPTVVCVGRLSRQKGQDLLLGSWPLVLDAVPDALLVLVGDGPARATLEAGAPPGVLFTGARHDSEDFLAAADVVTLPSRWEGSPLVALEAMAAGRAVVAAEVGGMRAALGDTGVLVPPDDRSGLAAAITAMLTDPAAAAAEGRAARERVVQVGDLRHCLKMWDGLLSSVAYPPRRTAPGLRVVPVTRLARSLAGGALRAADVAAPTGTGRMDRLRGAALSALGIPVRWPGPPATAPPASGAPVLSGPPDPARLAEAARRPGAGAPYGPAVSVVVTVLNEGPALARLVTGLLGQLTGGDEVVVVDGGSSDGSLAALVRTGALQVHTVPGAGISEGRNHGVRAARNEVIICTDAGCEVGPGFVDGFRRAFAADDPPVLVSGVYTALAGNAMQRAQALACYPQPSEVRRPSLPVRVYTRVFGTGYDPRFAVGRCMAFTRPGWAGAGGFPEDLATGEDVSFGLALARQGRCVASTDAEVAWTQRNGLADTWRMYRGYGRASTDGGHRALLRRDLARGLAYLAAPALLTHPRGRGLITVGAAAYLTLPLARAARARASAGTVVLLPVALAVKDLGKLTGALQGLARRRRRSR